MNICSRPECQTDAGCQCGWKLGPLTYVPHQPGCICPPTSEQTCQADFCPRKSVMSHRPDKLRRLEERITAIETHLVFP